MVGVVALAGVLCTLLPMWAVDLDPGDYSGYGVAGVDPELAGSKITLHVGFYDWLTSTAPVLALIPIALAVAVGAAVAQAVRATPERTIWGAAAAFAFCALVLAASVAVSPSAAVEVTGELSRNMRPGEFTVDQDSSLDVSYGAGLVISVIALVLVCGIAAWQYVVTPAPEDEPSR